MNHCGIQQNNFSSFNNGEPMVCPKPVKPIRWQMRYGIPDPEQYESSTGLEEVLDLMLPRGSGCYHALEHPLPQPRTLVPTSGCSGALEQPHTFITSSSPPYFCGSPPRRVSNPLIQDARFGDEKVSPISPWSMIIPKPVPGPAASSPSCLRTSYANKPSVRIEGFNSNRGNCSVAALA